MNMTVGVTEADIANGEKACREGCPIALAICRNPQVAGAKVGQGEAVVELWDGTEKAYLLPDEAREFLVSFDWGEPVDELLFSMEEMETCE